VLVRVIVSRSRSGACLKVLWLVGSQSIVGVVVIMSRGRSGVCLNFPWLVGNECIVGVVILARRSRSSVCLNFPWLVGNECIVGVVVVVARRSRSSVCLNFPWLIGSQCIVVIIVVTSEIINDFSNLDSQCQFSASRPVISTSSVPIPSVSLEQALMSYSQNEPRFQHGGDSSVSNESGFSHN
jgi:hypothetical protein